jgi:amino acid adenylation domain-containing protein
VNITDQQGDDKLISLSLTKRQSLIWIENSVHTGIPFNHVITLFSINGNILPDHFQRAFVTLVARHESLRGLIIETNEGPRYQVSSRIGEIDFVDLARKNDPDQAYQEWLKNRSTRLLDMTQCMYDAALVKIHNEKFVFFFNQHHAISDGSSTIFLHRELEKIYLQYLEQDDSASFEIVEGERSSYSEFLKKTEQYAASEEATSSKEFWEKRFATGLPAISYYGRSNSEKIIPTTRITRSLGPEVSRHIRNFGRELPSFMVFTTILFAFLHRITLNNDICIGIPFHNRTPEFLKTAGLIMEVVPCRVLIETDDDFESLFEKVRGEFRAVRPHARYAVSSRTAEFDVIFNNRPASLISFVDYPAKYDVTNPFNLQGSSSQEAMGNDGLGGHESLTVSIHHTEDNGDFNIGIDFNLGVWPDAAERDRAASHFARLVDAFIDDRKQKINSINLLGIDETKQLFPEEDSAFSRKETLPTVVDLIAEQVACRPDHPAIEFEDQVLTYRELDHRITRLSAYLRNKNVGQNTLVGVCLDRSPDLVVALLATMHAGATYIPIDPLHPDRRIEYILDDSKPLVLVSDQKNRHKLSADRQGQIVCLDDQIWSDPDNGQFDNVPQQGNLAYVIYTSGSTGRPKGVKIPHHGLSTFLRAMAKEPGLDKNDRLLAVTTVSFDIAALELFLPLTVGGTVCIAPHKATRNGEILSRLLEDKKITVIQATPATFRLLLTAGWQGNRKIRVLCGGEAFPANLAKPLLDRTAAVWNMFGPTETTIWSIIKKVGNENGPVPIGQPIPGTRAYVLNESLQPVPMGVPGELYLAGDGVARGYHGQENLTQERFVPDPFTARPSALMYRTGDLVRYMPNLDLEFIARNDFQVKIRGFRIELQEIEAVIAQHPMVSQCVVTTFENLSNVQALAAYVIPEKNVTSVSRDTITNDIQSFLPSYMIPTIFVNLQEFPLTPNGKIDRNALPAPDIGDDTSNTEEYAHPKTDLEISLSAAWQKVLNLNSVGLTDDFFELGGDSLLAFTLVMEMERATGFVIDLSSVFNTPTIAQLIKTLGSREDTLSSIVVPLQGKGDGNPLFCICGIHLYQELADCFGDHQPVHAVYANEEKQLLEELIKGSPVDVPIEKLAVAYCDAIQRYQINGPYKLTGISFGGVLAIEVASQLQSRGQPVEVVILIDTLLRHAIHQNRSKWIKKQIQKLLKGQVIELTVKGLRRIGSRFSTLSYGKSGVSNNGTTKPGDVRSAIRQAYLTALEKYEFSSYDGKAVLFRAMENDFSLTNDIDPDYGWQRYLVQKLNIHDVPGNHMSIIEKPNVMTLAEMMQSYLSD